MKHLKKLIKYLSPYLSRFIISLICMLIVAILTALSRWLLKPIIDKILYAKDIKLLILAVGVIPSIYLLNGLSMYLKNYINFSIANNVVKTIREETFQHLQKISIDYFYIKTTTGKTIARFTNDLNNIFTLLSKTPSAIFTDCITILGLIIVLFSLSIKFAIVCLIVLPLGIYPIYVFTRKLRHYSKKIQVEISELYNNLQESISAIVITRLFNQEKKEIEKFKIVNTKVYHALKKFNKVDIISSPLMEFIGSLGVALVLLFGGLDVIYGRWTIGGFFAFIAAALSFYQPLKRITELNSIIQQGIVSLERVFSILEEKSSVIEIPNPIQAKFHNKIEFINVSFSYDNQKLALKNVNLQILKNKKIDIVGPSGAGKSTVLNLLLRFYDVNDGEICIDGINIKKFSISSLRRLFGVVTQDTFLFNDTIRYNISYGNDNVTDEEIEKVAKLAHIYEVIEKLPQKFDTVVGEHGYALSVGERQRIAIARALLTNPEILVFDEPTSALDAESENIVMKAINDVIKNKTVLLITHRLNLIKDFDYIYVFYNGEIIEEGTHQELMAHSKFYSNLVNLQQG